MFHFSTGGSPSSMGERGRSKITGGDMDPVLREMCVEVLEGDIDSEKFASLLIQSGMEPKGFEWDFASRLLERGDQMRSTAMKFGKTVQ